MQKEECKVVFALLKASSKVLITNLFMSATSYVLDENARLDLQITERDVIQSEDKEMVLTIDELAKRIVALDVFEQETLLDKVAELNFQHGLESLSQKYRERLAQERKLSQSAEEIMAELKQVREEITNSEYCAQRNYYK